MDLEDAVFDNGDVVAATGLSPAAIQSWANRGILTLSEKQRNPGPGQRRQYSGLDIARIAATQSLIGYGLTASTAAQIAFRLERGPVSAQPWRRALQEGVSRIHVFVVDDFEVAAIYTGNDRTKFAQLLADLSEDLSGGPLGEGTKIRTKTAVFDIGPDVSTALETLRTRAA